MQSSIGSIFTIATIIIFLSSCSSTQQAYVQNIEMYIESGVDVALSNEEVQQAKSDLIFVKNGDRPFATMALAFIEDGYYKWLSNDGVMFITKNGRLVRTVGLEHNLIFTSDLSLDPLQQPNSQIDSSTWQRVVDSEFQDYGAQLESQFSFSKDISLSIQNTQFTMNKVVESVNYSSVKQGKESWKNIFWYHSGSGQLLKSVQKTTAQGETVEITYTSRAIRLLGASDE